MSEPTREEFLEGVKQFEKHERRDAMYKVATFLLSHFWSKPSDMADALGVLLLTWNQAFYRYGSFDFDKLERCIADNLQKLNMFRNRDISSLSRNDDDDIKDLFDKFLAALSINSGKKKGEKSPVSASKALHLLAPKFFPLWDYKIAKAYKSPYSQKPAQNYLAFCKTTKEVADTVRRYATPSDKTLLKMIDEYNYSKFTKGWIR